MIEIGEQSNGQSKRENNIPSPLFSYRGGNISRAVHSVGEEYRGITGELRGEINDR
jgi:hypothetical protein